MILIEEKENYFCILMIDYVQEKREIDNTSNKN